MYVIFEGTDGTGKDTQADRLATRLNGIRVNEPSTLPTGKLLRSFLVDGSYPESHAALFLADRMALLASKVRPELGEGRTVVSVRSWMSTLVYQQDQWPLSWLMGLHRQLPCKADVLILLDLDPLEALERASRRPGPNEYYECEGAQKRNRQRYLNLVPIAPDFLAPDAQILIVSAQGTPDDVEKRIVDGLRMRGIAL